VAYVLERSGEGTALTVAHTGVQALPLVAEWPQEHLAIGWWEFLTGLRYLVDGGDTKIRPPTP